jgi:hypothetical protein
VRNSVYTTFSKKSHNARTRCTECSCLMQLLGPGKHRICLKLHWPNYSTYIIVLKNRSNNEIRIRREFPVCAKLVQNMINDSCHHLFSELQHAEFKEAFNEFDKVRIYIFYYRVSHSEKCKVNQI